MTDDLSSKVVLVIDSGLYLHVAVKLAESFGRVLLFVPWIGNGFPSEKQRQIGTGIPNVERVTSLWANARKADLVVVTDIYWHDEIAELRRIGKPVWGAGYAEALEIERWKTKQLMEEIGMNVIPYDVVIGADALREYLVDKDEAWVKASVTRGDWETMHWQGDHLSRPLLEKNINNLGPRAKTKEFIVEPPVEGCEIGYDGYCVDGRFSQVASYGYEDKDAGYIMRVCRWGDLPDLVRAPTLEFAPLMARLGCRGFYSNEIRITPEGTPYLIDPCLRCGSPPSESYIELFSNWAQVIWAGAHGEVIDLEPAALFAAEIVLKSPWVGDDDAGEREYLPVYFPPEISRWIKLHNYCLLDGQPTVTPQKFPQFGAAIGLGDTKDEAQEAAIEHAEQVEALKMDWHRDVFDSLDKRIEECRKLGIDF